MMGSAMTEHTPRRPTSKDDSYNESSTEEFRPAKEFDESAGRSSSAGGDESTTFNALFTLLQGALADPVLPHRRNRTVVPIIRGLARGEIKAKDLL